MEAACEEALMRGNMLFVVVDREIESVGFGGTFAG